MLPSLTVETGVQRYLKEIYSIPMLTKEEEDNYSIRWCEQGDVQAAQKLVLAHLRLVVKVATRFKNYGIPLLDLISEGNIGLMKAVKKFKREMNCRIATYALLWIRASIQDFILKSWSLLKVSTTVVKKKLFYNLNNTKRRIEILDDSQKEGALNDQGLQTQLLSEMQGIQDLENQMMSISRNISSLNHPINGEQEGSIDLIDIIPDDRHNQEYLLLAKEDNQRQKIMLHNAISKLSHREKHIIHERKLKQKPSTLDALAETYKISRERVRQIEERAIEKLKSLVQAQETLSLKQLVS